MAQATAEAAVRGAELSLLSPAPPPPQWSSWRAAAGNLGVTASWKVVSAGPRHGGMPDAALAEAARACLVVTDTASLQGGLGPSLARHADLYVVAQRNGKGRSRMRDPAVVVGVPDRPDDTHLLSVAAREAALRHRHLIVVHAQSRALATPDHLMEHRWLDALSLDRQTGAGSSAPRVVLTHRSVLDALRDHVEVEDVLVVGVHPLGDAQEEGIDASLLEAPPCDLLLTSTTGVAAGGEFRHVPDELQAPPPSIPTQDLAAPSLVLTPPRR